MPADMRAWSPLARAQAIEIATFMSPYLLSCQGDRVSLGHGVEARYPFLDPRVIDFAQGLPSNLKLSGLKDKLILRKLGARHLPQDISARPKQPYRAPTTTSFFGPGAPGYVRELLSPDMLAAHGLVEVEPTRMLAEKAWAREGRLSGEREEMALIGILSLQILAHWLRHELPQTVAAETKRLRTGAPSVIIDRCAA